MFLTAPPAATRIPAKSGARARPEEWCSCPDFTYHCYPEGKACKHIIAVAVKHAKGRSRSRRNFIAAFLCAGGEV
jgi:hypothetical protein